MKRVANNYYTHISSLGRLYKVLSDKQRDYIGNCINTLCSKGITFDIIKFNLSDNRVSLIRCVDFNSKHEPTVGDSYCFSCEGERYKVIKGGTKVYHKKYLFVSEDYTGFNVEKEKERALYLDTLERVKENKNKIGNLNYWLETLQKYGIDS